MANKNKTSKKKKKSGPKKHKSERLSKRKGTAPNPKDRRSGMKRMF